MKREKMEHPSSALFQPLTMEQSQRLVGGFLRRPTGVTGSFDDMGRLVDGCTDRQQSAYMRYTLEDTMISG